ncbi:hypothetical protein GUJ93_ZPchr0006g42086 [Zizania palustris]|uniref:Uncharacterized protein n=1 Tax=Zizania palustris TaxID=103762 RepID=A0A8J5VVM8_ZIZPA|nr:hypothetical protein GUJ93_ZPchr0006g42086 [Zizania palustris]
MRRALCQPYRARGTSVCTNLSEAELLNRIEEEEIKLGIWGLGKDGAARMADAGGIGKKAEYSSDVGLRVVYAMCTHHARYGGYDEARRWTVRIAAWREADDGDGLCSA